MYIKYYISRFYYSVLLLSYMIWDQKEEKRQNDNIRCFIYRNKVSKEIDGKQKRDSLQWHCRPIERKGCSAAW